MGVLYILDEPSIGLHARDNGRLLETLISLRDMGNTVLVVEHDEETIRAADHVIDMGPGAGPPRRRSWRRARRRDREEPGLAHRASSCRARADPGAAKRRRPGSDKFSPSCGASENNLRDLTCASRSACSPW